MRDKSKRRQLLSMLTALAWLPPLAATPAAMAEQPAIWLEVGGTADLAFAGTCELETAAGRETVEIAAEIPHRQGFAARRVECRLHPSTRGRLDIVLRSSDSGVTVRSAVAGGPGSTANIAIAR